MIVKQEVLEAVACMRPSLPPSEGRRGIDPSRNGHKELDLATWIEEHGVPVKREGPWINNDGYKYVLEECPWKGHTDSAAYIVQLRNGAIAAGCHHNSCQGYGWQDLRKHYEPEAYERADSDYSANSAN